MRSLFLTLFFLTALANSLAAQPILEKDYTTTMEIPSIITVESSPAHLYVLSRTEGMVVFRTRGDSLRWLYSSTGMQQRGNTVTADIRFAYLFGDGSRLTVLEPTSVLGVYSSTLLPAPPLDAKRIDQNLFVALGKEGIGSLSLATPSAVDSTMEQVGKEQIGASSIIDLEASGNQLFALSSDQKLFVFKSSQTGITLSRELSLFRELNHIYLLDDLLVGTDRNGNMYEVDRGGELSKMGSIGEEVTKISRWKEWLIIRGISNRIWTSFKNRSPVLWKKDREAGNHFTVTGRQFWLSEYNNVSRIATSRKVTSTERKKTPPVSSDLSLKSIPDQVIPYPKPLLIGLELEKSFPAEQVQFAYQSDINSAKIKKNGFYWQPKADDVGSHRFTIVATASDGSTDRTSFTVDVRSFNAPPRFAPLRPISIPVGEPFNLPVTATDPDGMHPELVRYLGVDLPEGASVDEQTGEFKWTPTPRQVGENKFRVIATDQYGAASSVNISIRVIEKPDTTESGDEQ